MAMGWLVKHRKKRNRSEAGLKGEDKYGQSNYQIIKPLPTVLSPSPSPSTVINKSPIVPMDPRSSPLIPFPSAFPVSVRQFDFLFLFYFPFHLQSVSGLKSRVLLYPVGERAGKIKTEREEESDISEGVRKRETRMGGNEARGERIGETDRDAWLFSIFFLFFVPFFVFLYSFFFLEVSLSLAGETGLVRSAARSGCGALAYRHAGGK